MTDDALERGLRRELSEGIANAFLSRAAYSNRLKRKLLVRISTAIDQRRFFHQDLEAEEDALERAASDLRDIAAKTAALPECSIQNAHLEDLLKTREAYGVLEDDCQWVIARRQRQLCERAHRISPP